MATPSPPPPPPTPSSLDLTLNLMPSSKPPKPEPIHIPLSPPSSSSTPLPLQVLAPLQSIPPNGTTNLDEDALFAEYYRLATRYCSSAAPSSSSQSLIPFPPPPTPESLAVSTPQPPVKKRKPRSSDMVRVSSLTIDDLIYFRNSIRRARITFESLRIQITHNQHKADELGLTEHVRNNRADLRAAALMADRNLWLNRDKRIIGSIPGISVGDAFFFRMELCVLGLHGHVQAGIDYVPASQSSSGEPVATSIIVSGG